MAETIRVLFLDRDGTINEDIGSYITTREEFRLIDRAGEAIALAKDAGYRIVVVTNQAGIARGLVTVEQVEEVNRYLNELLVQWNTAYDRCYYCPSHPDYPDPEYDRFTECRKPATGMVDRAITDFLAEGFVVDCGLSFFIGDKAADIECGLRAGLRTVLVRTGHNEEHDCLARGIVPGYVADDLYRAVTRHVLA